MVSCAVIAARLSPLISSSRPFPISASTQRPLRLSVIFGPTRRTGHKSRLHKSFRIRSYANRPILHYFGANKSSRIRSYRHPARNPFRIRSYKHPGGWHPSLGNSVQPSGSVSLCFSPPRPRDGKNTSDLHNFSAPITTFRINTCVSVASKRLYLPLESTLMKKGGEGGGPHKPKKTTVRAT
jgi:hypothetical protein